MVQNKLSPYKTLSNRKRHLLSVFGVQCHFEICENRGLYVIGINDF